MNNKCNSLAKLTLCCIIGLVFLASCGGYDESLPKITDLNYQFNEGRIVVDASDDVKITGYLLTYTLDEPKIDDESWQESGIFYELKVGNAVVWVKDADGNLARSEIIIEDPITLLAKDYEFLQWYLDDSTTKIVDGVTHDLTALKQKYGDLYRFVEPLSKDEVEYRFNYLVDYYAEQDSKGILLDNPGGLAAMGDRVFTSYVDTRKDVYRKLTNKSIVDLIEFSNYYFYLEKTDNYYSRPPRSMLINDEFYPKNLIKIIQNITYDDKNWFVRDEMFQIEIALNAFSKENEVPVFAIEVKN